MGILLLDKAVLFSHIAYSSVLIIGQFVARLPSLAKPNVYFCCQVGCCTNRDNDVETAQNGSSIRMVHIEFQQLFAFQIAPIFMSHLRLHHCQSG